MLCSRTRVIPNCSPKSLSQTNQDAFQNESGLSLINFTNQKTKMRSWEWWWTQELKEPRTRRLTWFSWFSSAHIHGRNNTIIFYWLLKRITESYRAALTGQEYAQYNSNLSLYMSQLLFVSFTRASCFNSSVTNFDEAQKITWRTRAITNYNSLICARTAHDSLKQKRHPCKSF